jgi:hypothetical protein
MQKQRKVCENFWVELQLAILCCRLRVFTCRILHVKMSTFEVLSSQSLWYDHLNVVGQFLCTGLKFDRSFGRNEYWISFVRGFSPSRIKSPFVMLWKYVFCEFEMLMFKVFYLIIACFNNPKYNTLPLRRHCLYRSKLHGFLREIS